MKNEDKFSVFLSMTEIDDEFITEACEAKGRRARPGRLLPLLAAAALIAIFVLMLVLSIPKKLPEHSVSADPSPLPTDGAVVSAAPADTDIHTQAASPSPSETVNETHPVLPTDGFETNAAQTEIPTPAPTGGGTALPSLTPLETARPSEWQTPWPTSQITASPVTPAPTATPAPTPPPALTETPRPMPTHPPTVTETPRPTPTPPATQTPTEAPTQPPGPQPTLEPQPTGIVEPETLYYHSFEAFEADIRNHAYALLNGLETYYVPKDIEPGVVFVYICVTPDDVTITYRAAETVWRDFGWSRVHDGSYISEIVSQYSGEWHGDRYVHIKTGGDPSTYVWWAQYGKLFSVRVSGSADYGAIEDFCFAKRMTV